MTEKLPVKTDSMGGGVPAEAGPDLTYLEWVTKAIRESKWYVGDGGFVAQAMNAESLEEATATSALISGRDHEGTVFRFLDATFADSDLDGQLPFYAVCQVIDPASGSVEKWACGGARIVATLYRAAERGWFPFDASVSSVDMGSGKAALNLVLAPRPVKSETA